ncbi:MAG: hypothetical protein IPL71_07995 [Anaerolineales bacterium]|uniref:hypothetical protein n=1 Tax=Candidatus Villigracilis proximus TaxID=3140683 RepID=UPI003134D098|nr:hypothetical protein [Anaerolineales bacterium]
MKKRVDSLDLKIEKSVPKREEKAVVEKKVPENKTKPYSNKETKVKEKKLLAETPGQKKT